MSNSPKTLYIKLGNIGKSSIVQGNCQQLVLEISWLGAREEDDDIWDVPEEDEHIFSI